MLSGGLPMLSTMPYYGDLGIYEVQTLSASPTSPDIEFTCFMMVQTGRYIWKQKCGKFLPHFCLLRGNILFEAFEAFGNILFNSAKDGFLV